MNEYTADKERAAAMAQLRQYGSSQQAGQIQAAAQERGRIVAATGILSAISNRLASAFAELAQFNDAKLGQGGPSSSDRGKDVRPNAGQLGDLTDQIVTLSQWVEGIEVQLQRLKEI